MLEGLEDGASWRPTEKPHCQSSAASLRDGHLYLLREKLERVVWLPEFLSAEAQSHFSYLLLLPALKKAMDETVFSWELNW